MRSIKNSIQPKNYKYKSYVLKGQEDHLRTLTKLLDQHQLNYSYGTGAMVKGFNYKSGKTGSLKTNSESIIISTNQTRGTLVKVLFEPNAKLSDSLTYDITAWSLPYAYGLDAIASESLINGTSKTENLSKKGSIKYKYICLPDRLERNGRCPIFSRITSKKISGYDRLKNHLPWKEKDYDRGSLIITKAG